MQRRRPFHLSATTVVAALAAAVAALALLGGEASAAPAAAIARTTPVTVALLQGERIAAVQRSVPASTPLRGALLALLAGPTSAERRDGLATAVPPGTVLRGVSLRAGVATVDLSRRFEAGGGTLAMRARLVQLVRTATAVAGVRSVLLRLDGRTAVVFSGEGLILDQPLTRAAWATLG